MFLLSYKDDFYNNNSNNAVHCNIKLVFANYELGTKLNNTTFFALILFFSVF